MPAYSQTNRPIRVETALGTDKLLLEGFVGTEAVSRPFTFELDMVAEDDSVDAVKLLRKGATITVSLPDGTDRHIHGLVRRLTQLDKTLDLTRYRAELVPWFWFLSLSRDCRIYQQMSVIEIVQDVFKRLGYSDYDVKCARTYPKREYCVQYRESDLDFVSRLLEEEGIFYFFRHEKAKHTLVLADENATAEPCPGGSRARVAERGGPEEDVVTEVRLKDSVCVGKVTLRDYDALQPSLTLKSEISGKGVEEVYDYQPVVFTEIEQGDRYARVRLEAEEAGRQVVEGAGTCRAFRSGSQVTFEEHYRSDVNTSYLLLEVKHDARTSDYRTQKAPELDYRNEFRAIRSSVPFRPPATMSKPVMRGSQTAVVVGKSKEEIWTDKHGRVKVQFHWDRTGKKDENSSCWVRVSSQWAGKAWGVVSLPRVGQEVVVDFLEGDPDRPIVTGSVYNADQAPPYPLPKNQTQSGIKSRSSKKGGTENYNELRFEDKKGEELVYIHAEKDKHVEVENDRTEDVGNDESITIGHDRVVVVKHDETITIENDRTEEVKQNESVKIGGNRSEDVGKDEKVTVKGDRKQDVKGDEDVTVGKGREVAVGKNDRLDVKGDIEATAKNVIGTAKGKLTLKANQSIELKVGASSIKISPSGIELKAPQIKVQGTAKVDLKAPMVTGKADAMLQLQGAMTQVKGDGVVMMKGGVAMIN